MSGRLEGKVALVTGGSSGIGRASAQACAGEGARVVIADIDVAGGEETVRMIKKAGGEAIFVKTDVSKAGEVESMVDKAVKTYGRLDCAFNNSGTEGLEAYITEDTEENWDHVVSIDLKGVWLCMKYEITYMAEHGGGAIVNNSSVAGQAGSDRCMPYVASKHGVVGMTKAAALEYSNKGIRVNAVCPGPILTPLVERVDGRDPRRLVDVAGAVPMERVGNSEEVAEAVAWLFSDAASFVTGHALSVDGGYLAGHYSKGK